MLIPRYWSRAESQAVTPDGRPVHFHVWRGSRTSEDDAQALATEAVGRIADRIRRGEGFPERYSYGDRPLREEVVREMPGGSAQVPDAALTRNTYGALVLNAARAFFIDVDVPNTDGGSSSSSSSPSSSAAGDNPVNALLDVVDSLPLPGALKSIFGAFRSSPKPAPAQAPARTPTPVMDPRGAAMLRLREFVDARPGWRVRVYRTSAGLRYLVTHAPFSPTDAEAHAAMQALGADPQYMRLCQVQKSFRARLTPKPWRMGLENPPVSFPFDDAAEEQRMREWESRYDRASQGYATCQFVEEFGSGAEHPDIAPLRALHDEHTRATSGLRLA
jgi:hypothetical protein